MQKLCKQLGYDFKDIAWLELALTHRSSSDKNNERLEFLGDSLLNFCIAEKLFHECPHYHEGELSRLRANLVNGEVLATLAKALGINKHLKMGAGELASGGLERKSTLADAMEAIIGAVYLDGGMETCRQQLTMWFDEVFAKAISRGIQKDPKTQLQEYVQAQKIALPVYTVLSMKGHKYTQSFQVSCHIPTLHHAVKGMGSSRKRAEQDAATKLLALLGL
jgi:ribonuclease-3